MFCDIKHFELTLKDDISYKMACSATTVLPVFSFDFDISDGEVVSHKYLSIYDFSFGDRIQ